VCTNDVGTLLVDEDLNLAILVIQTLAVNATQVVNERVEADVLYNIS